MIRKCWPGLLIALFALLLRLHQIDWGLPDWFEEAVSVKRAWGMWTWGEDGFDFNPHFFIYPSLYFYLQFAVQAIVRATGWALRIYPTADSFHAAYYLNSDLFLLAGRTLTALLGSATVWIAFSIGRRLAGMPAAILGALFLALNAVHLEKCRFVEVDVAMTFFAALSFLFLVKYLDDGRHRNVFLAAGAIGLAAATKYPGAILLINIPVALLLRRDRSFIRIVVMSGLVAVLLFVIAAPYVLLDFETFRNDFAGQTYHMKMGHFGREAEGLGGAWRHFTAGFGAPLFLLAFAGAIAAFVAREKERLLVPFPMLLFALLAVSRMQDPHYPLPAIPPIALLGAIGLTRLLPTALPARKLVLGAAAILLLWPPGGKILDLHEKLAAPDTRRLARIWIESNIEPGALIVAEPHGPQLSSVLRLERFAEAPEFRAIRRQLLDTFASRPAYHVSTIPSYDISWWRSARFYQFDPYQWVDFIVISSSIRDRYREDPERFPVQNRYYDEVGRRFRLIRSFEPAGGLGPTIEVYGRIAGPTGIPDFHLDRAGTDDEIYQTFLLKQGTYYEKVGRYEPAAAIYRALIELTPESADPWIQLGTLLGKTKGPGAGIPFLEQAVAIDRSDRRARRNLAVLLSRAGEIERGARLFEELLQEDDRDGEIHLAYASSLLALGEQDRAVRHFERFLALAPDHPRAGDIQQNLKMLELAPGGPADSPR